MCHPHVNDTSARRIQSSRTLPRDGLLDARAKLLESLRDRFLRDHERRAEPDRRGTGRDHDHALLVGVPDDLVTEAAITQVECAHEALAAGVRDLVGELSLHPLEAGQELRAARGGVLEELL